MYLSVIIPAYNEEKRIGTTLESIKGYLTRQSYEWEIIVVNNNSEDKTRQIAEGFGVRVIDEARPGKGYAVKAGMLEATGELRVFTDADNSTSIDHVERMMPFIGEHEIVIGSLAMPGAKIVQGGGEPWYRVIMGKLGNKFIQLVAVWGISDTQRGFKLFTSKAVEAIFPKLTIFGWGFDVEVLALAKKLKYKIKEVPVIWDNDPNSKVNIWAYPEVLLQTLKIRWNLITNYYGI